LSRERKELVNVHKEDTRKNQKGQKTAGDRTRREGEGKSHYEEKILSSVRYETDRSILRLGGRRYGENI